LQYNEIVAWIRLKSDGDVIKAYAWDVQQRRFRRGFTPFPFEGGVGITKVFEVWVDYDYSSRDIYEKLREELVALIGADGTFAGRHLDLRVFDAIAPHVDWRSV
jgi:hypothetical protein